MRSYLVRTFRVLAVVSSHFNSAAIQVHAEVVSCLVVSKSHRLVAVLLDIGMMVG